MGTLIWLMVSALLLAITIFIHRNTYEYDRYEKNNVGDRLPLPMWLLIIALVLAIIPGVNIFAFIIGVIAYCISAGECNIVFHCEARWWKSFIGFLTREV